MTAPQQKDLFTKRWRRRLAEPQKEATFHIQLVSMLRHCIRPDVIFRHYPAGELRDIRIAQKLKAMGVLPGSADLEFFWRHYSEDQEGSHFELRVLFLELKLPGRKCSEAQVAFALAAKLLGKPNTKSPLRVDEAIALLGERGLIKSGIEVCGKRW